MTYFEEKKTEALEQIKDLTVEEAVNNLKKKHKRIYFIVSEGHIKIGTSNNVGIRRCQLQTGNQYDLKIIYETKYMKNPYHVENELHKMFEYCKKRGEWFEFDEVISKMEDAIELVEREADDIVTLEEVKEEIKSHRDMQSLAISMTYDYYITLEKEEQEPKKKILSRFNELDTFEIKEDNLMDDLNDYIECCRECGEEEFDNALKIKKDVMKNGFSEKAKEYVDYIITSGESVLWDVFEYYGEERSKVIKFAMEKIGLELTEDMILV